MTILSIETSCDETAIALINVEGDFPHARYTVLGDALLSQIELHRQYGGVFPTLAKREHAAALVPVLEKVLEAAKPASTSHAPLSSEQSEQLTVMLAREHGLAEALRSFYEKHAAPSIDLIAVTEGPGLEPALWVGINFAKALGYLWNVPVVGENHMEGHIFSSIFDGTKITDIAFPALALLISGGHTEIVLMREWDSYELIGKTRDDAVGEAFDKVARMLGLPYPGGPEISKLADIYAASGKTPTVSLPRPMIDSKDFDFSFSGLKTAVLYRLKDAEVTDDMRVEMAYEFQNAVTEVLLAKVSRAADTYGARTIILGGGVSANKHIRNTFSESFKDSGIDVCLPAAKLTTDNAVMIALAAHARHHKHDVQKEIIADGNLAVSAAKS